MTTDKMKDNEKGIASTALASADITDTERGAAAPGYPEMLTVAPSPHIRSSDSVRTVMADVIIALTPALLFGIFIFGWKALVLTLVSIASCVLFEFLFERITKRNNTIGDLSAVVTGLLLALNVPSTLNPFIIVVGAFFAIVVVKQVFGGIGKNIVNPALAGRVFMFLSWPTQMAGYPELDGIASATPLAQLKSGAVDGIDFSRIIQMFLGVEKSGVIGEISAFLLIAGFVYMLVRRTVTWHIPVAYIGTVALITLVLPKGFGYSIYFMLAELFTGGLMLGAIFMATDYATSPVTKTGRLIYGVICGLITVFIRYFGAYNEGVSFAILIANLLVYYIDRFTRPKPFGYRKPSKVKEGKA